MAVTIDVRIARDSKARLDEHARVHPVTLAMEPTKTIRGCYVVVVLLMNDYECVLSRVEQDALIEALSDGETQRFGDA